MLASWESGKQEEAVDQLLSIRWDDAALFADVPLMSLSEDDLGSMADDERTRTMEQIIALNRTLRGLARRACSAADNARASGDKQTATAHYEAVLRLGQAVSSPERVLALQLVGKAITKLAQQGLSAVK